MDIKFPLTQEGYNEWHAHWMAKAADPDDETYEADVNDMNFILAVGVQLMKLYPEKVERLEAVLPEVVVKAGNELGMFMGMRYLGQQVGIDPVEVEGIGKDLLGMSK